MKFLNWFKRKPKEDYIKIILNGQDIDLEFHIEDLQNFTKMFSALVNGKLTKPILVNTLKTLYQNGKTDQLNYIVSNMETARGPLVNPAECLATGEENDE